MLNFYKHSRDITIFWFSKWPLQPSWIFEFAKFYWLPESSGLTRITIPNFVKLVNMLWRYCNLKKIRWRQPTSSIFKFVKLADGVWRAQTHHCAKCRQNRSFHCWDIAILWIFKMAATSILDLWNRKILWLSVETHQRVNFVKISQSVMKIIRFFKMAQSTIFDLFGAYLDHPQWVLGGLYHSAKFGCDRCSSLYDMNI